MLITVFIQLNKTHNVIYWDLFANKHYINSNLLKCNVLQEIHDDTLYAYYRHFSQIILYNIIIVNLHTNIVFSDIL